MNREPARSSALTAEKKTQHGFVDTSRFLPYGSPFTKVICTKWSSSCYGNCWRFSIWSVHRWPKGCVDWNVGGRLDDKYPAVVFGKRWNFWGAWVYPMVVNGSFIFLQAQLTDGIRATPARSYHDLRDKGCLWCPIEDKTLPTKIKPVAIVYFHRCWVRTKITSHPVRFEWVGHKAADC